MDDSLSYFRIIFNMQNFLGEGGFETVRAAIRKSDNMSVAIKEIMKGNIVEYIDKTPIEIVLLQKSVQHFWCYQNPRLS